MSIAENLIFPELWPDETIYSLVARIARLNGMSHLATISQLMGVRNPRSVIGCPVDISHFCRVTKYRYGFPKDILHLTILPLMAHLNEVSQADMTDIENGILKPQFGALVLGLSSGNYWQICNECVTQEIKVYGTSYWHLCHQLPVCQYCPEHGIQLIRVGIPRVRMYDHLYLPNEFTNLIDNTEKYFTVAPSEIFMRMAILSQDALADHSAPFTEKIIQAAFLKGLNQKELLTFNLKLNLSGYLDLLKQTNQSEVVIKAILRLSSIRTPEQLLNGILLNCV